MHEIKDKESSPTFSVQIDITDTERKLIFIGNGDRETSELFFKTLKKLSERLEKSDSFMKPLYEIESIKEKETNISISKEVLEELLYAILLL